MSEFKEAMNHLITEENNKLTEQGIFDYHITAQFSKLYNKTTSSYINFDDLTRYTTSNRTYQVIHKETGKDVTSFYVEKIATKLQQIADDQVLSFKEKPATVEQAIQYLTRLKKLQLAEIRLNSFDN